MTNVEQILELLLTGSDAIKLGSFSNHDNSILRGLGDTDHHQITRFRSDCFGAYHHGALQLSGVGEVEGGDGEDGCCQPLVAILRLHWNQRIGYHL